MGPVSELMTKSFFNHQIVDSFFVVLLVTFLEIPQSCLNDLPVGLVMVVYNVAEFVSDDAYLRIEWDIL